MIYLAHTVSTGQCWPKWPSLCPWLWYPGQTQRKRAASLFIKYLCQSHDLRRSKVPEVKTAEVPQASNCSWFSQTRDPQVQQGGGEDLLTVIKSHPHQTLGPWGASSCNLLELWFMEFLRTVKQGADKVVSLYLEPPLAGTRQEISLYEITSQSPVPILAWKLTLT